MLARTNCKPSSRTATLMAKLQAKYGFIWLKPQAFGSARGIYGQIEKGGPLCGPPKLGQVKQSAG